MTKRRSHRISRESAFTFTWICRKKHSHAGSTTQAVLNAIFSQNFVVSRTKLWSIYSYSYTVYNESALIKFGVWKLGECLIYRAHSNMHNSINNKFSFRFRAVNLLIISIITIIQER